MLKVTGDSMIGAAIAEGDLVVVREQLDAKNGDIIAARIDGEATVKTFQRTAEHVWLMPHNPAYAPILGDEATIMGRIVTVIRRVDRRPVLIAQRPTEPVWPTERVPRPVSIPG